MDREILFRGKRMDNAGWVYGLLTIMWGSYHIIDLEDENTAYPVDIATVGQYTGLTDKNGVRIFEGDFCVVRGSGTLAYGFITFYQGSFVFEEDKTKNLLRLCDAEINGYLIEVRGNIHDNPELLKGGAV